MPFALKDRTLIPVWIAVLAASLIHVSIAAAQMFLGVGIVALLVLRRPIRFPGIAKPLAAFFLWTLLSLTFSGDPWGGRAQVRKFFVFLFVPLVFETFRRTFERTRELVIGWTATAAASGLWGLAQFYLKYHHSEVTGEDFYTAYVAARITGFESHWMTFGALQLSVLLVLLAHLFFARKKLPWWMYSTLLLFSITIVLGWTRSIWLASAPSVLYLFWVWKPRLIWIAPVVGAILIAVAPATTQDRLLSLIDPHGDTDSNQHRIVTFETGLAMIRAHPVLGLGPEQVGKQFMSYVPSFVPRPLPVGYYGHLHNIYLQYAAERGIPALLAMLWLIGKLLWDCRIALKICAKDSDIRFAIHGVVAATIAILVGGLFEFNLGDSEVLMMFTALIGLAYAAKAQAEVRIQTASFQAN